MNSICNVAESVHYWAISTAMGGFPPVALVVDLALYHPANVGEYIEGAEAEEARILHADAMTKGSIDKKYVTGQLTQDPDELVVREVKVPVGKADFLMIGLGAGPSGAVMTTIEHSGVAVTNPVNGSAFVMRFARHHFRNGYLTFRIVTRGLTALAFHAREIYGMDDLYRYMGGVQPGDDSIIAVNQNMNPHMRECDVVVPVAPGHTRVVVPIRHVGGMPCVGYGSISVRRYGSSAEDVNQFEDVSLVIPAAGSAGVKLSTMLGHHWYVHASDEEKARFGAIRF